MLAIKALLLCIIAAPISAAEFAFVTNQNSDDVSIIDLTKLEEVKRVHVGGKPAGVDVTSGVAYIVSPDSKSVTKLSLKTGELLAKVSLPGGPIGVATAQGRVFVTDFYNARIWVLDAETLKVEKELATASAPAGIAVSERFDILVAADRDADAISIYTLTDLSLRYQTKVGVRPFAVTIHPDSGHIYAANVGSNSLSVVDHSTGEVVGTVPSGDRPYGVTFAQGKGFVTDQYADTLTIFDPISYKVLDTIDTGEYPEGIDVSHNGERIYVANWFSNALWVFDAKTNDLIAEIETGDGPRAFGKFVAQWED